MPTSSRSTVVSRIPPPLLFAAAFLSGLALERRLTGDVIASPGLHRAAGAVVVVLGLAIMVWAATILARRRTTLIPHRMPSSFIRQGPYQLTRNPMYIGLTILYVGLALWTGAWAAAPLVIVPLLVIDRVTIPMEETHLREKFGDGYRQYCAEVRRWI